MGLLDSVLGQVLAGQQKQGGSQGGAGGLGDLLGGILGGAGQGAGGQGGLGNVLGDLLGGGQAQTQQQSAPGGFNINPALIAALLPILMNMLSNSNSGGGGLGGLLNKFTQAGHGDVANSWIGTGQNIPVTGAQVSDAFGQGTIGDIASKLGVDGGTAAGGIAAILPELIDRLTPQGQAPAGGLGSADDIVGMLGRMLQK